MTFAIRGVGGHTHATAKASLSGTGDTNRGSFLLNLIENSSIWGMCHLWQSWLKIPWWRDHSVWITWFDEIACLLSCSTCPEYGDQCSSGRTMTGVSKEGHNEPDFIHLLLVYVGNNSGIARGYQNSLVPAKVLRAFQGQLNCLQFQEIDV